nr:alpha,alpha-trehalose-phosphate synthase [UDP-forming] 1-like [Tanacetum cinerariifolium]
MAATDVTHRIYQRTDALDAAAKNHCFHWTSPLEIPAISVAADLFCIHFDCSRRVDQFKEMKLKLHLKVKEALKRLCEDPKTKIVILKLQRIQYMVGCRIWCVLRMPNKKWIRNLPEVQMDWVDSVKVRYLQVYNGLEENGVRSSDDGVKNESEKDDVEESKVRRDYNKVKRPLTLEENVTTTESPKRKK